MNTLPNNTIEAFEDHGNVARTVDANSNEAERILSEISSLGIDLEEVGDVLETEGIDSFIVSFENLIESLSVKASSFQ